MEKYITFSVPTQKECDNSKITSYKLKFIDSVRFMSRSLSSIVDNLLEIYNKEYKKWKEREKKICKNADLLVLKITNQVTNV